MPFPNKDTQFKPGQSGNPDGKPKGTLSLSTHIQNLLNDEDFSAWVSDPKVGVREVTGAPMKAIVQALIVKAINGDTKAFDMLGKYGYGSKVDVTSNGETLKTALVEFVDDNK